MLISRRLLCHLLATAAVTTAGSTGSFAQARPVDTVPAVAPDSIPLTIQLELRDTTKWVRRNPQLGGVWPRGFVMVLFVPNTSQSARQAAIDAVQGTVVGGTRLGTDGVYLVRIPDDGTPAPVLQALSVLDTMPGVAAAAQVAFTSAPRLVLSVVQDTTRPPIPPTQWPTTPLLAPWPGDTQNVYYRNLVGIVFDTSASGVVINEVLRRYQATIIGGSAPPYGTGAYYVQIPDPGPTLASLDSIVLRISTETGVAEAYHIDYRLRVDFR